MTNAIQPTTSPAYQRWEEKSPVYKRDLIIKVIATSTLAILGVTLFIGGMAVLLNVTAIPSALCTALIATTLLGPPLLLGSSLASVLYLHPHTLHSYHKEKGAKKVCCMIRSEYVSMPPPGNTERIDGTERLAFKKQSKAWVRYGLMTAENRNRLLSILKKDKLLRASIVRTKRLLNSPTFTASDRRDFQPQLEQAERQCRNKKKEWEQIMKNEVIPDLPF